MALKRTMTKEHRETIIRGMRKASIKRKAQKVNKIIDNIKKMNPLIQEASVNSNIEPNSHYELPTVESRIKDIYQRIECIQINNTNQNDALWRHIMKLQDDIIEIKGRLG